LVWFKFFLCLAVILIAGTKLSRYGDAIAEKTGLGRIWIGLILIATITSMPDLATGISSVALVGAPKLALGTLIGSCTFNLAIIALLDILYRPKPLLSEASSRHTASAGWGILLIAIAGGSILAGSRISGVAIGWFGVPSIIIVLVYLAGVRRIFHYERAHPLGALPASPLQYENISKRTVYLGFAVAAIAIIAAGIWLSFIGDEISVVTHWDKTFVGSLFLAVTTSLPEVVVAVAALRLAAIDMGVAALLGSNMFNIAIIAPVDLFYKQGSILSLAAPEHLVTIVVAVAMSLIVIAALRLRAKRKTFAVMSWYAPVLIGLYIFGAYAIFTSGLGTL
jgi:cation:H+ antiporter